MSNKRCPLCNSHLIYLSDPLEFNSWEWHSKRLHGFELELRRRERNLMTDEIHMREMKYELYKERMELEKAELMFGANLLLSDMRLNDVMKRKKKPLRDRVSDRANEMQALWCRFWNG